MSKDDRGVLRDRDHRRRPGRPDGRLLPVEAESPVRDPRRERAGRRCLAQALGFASSLHPARFSTAARHATPRDRPGRTRRRTSWPTTSRTTPSGSSFPCARASASTGSPRSTAGSSSRRATSLRGGQRRRRNRGASDSEGSGLRARARSAGSCSCTPPSTSIRRSCRRATCSWSAQATPVPRSRSDLSRRIAVWLSGPKTARSPSPTAPFVHGSAFASSGSSATAFSRRYADRPEAGAEAPRERRPVDPDEAERPPGGRRRARSEGRGQCGTVCRCSRTIASSTWRTSSGARGSGRTSAGSTCRCSATTGSRSMSAESSSPSRACTSSGWSSSTRSRPMCFRIAGETPSTSRSTSFRGRRARAWSGGRPALAGA